MICYIGGTWQPRQAWKTKLLFLEEMWMQVAVTLARNAIFYSETSTIDITGVSAGALAWFGPRCARHLPRVGPRNRHHLPPAALCGRRLFFYLKSIDKKSICINIYAVVYLTVTKLSAPAPPRGIPQGNVWNSRDRVCAPVRLSAAGRVRRSLLLSPRPFILVISRCISPF